MSYKGWEVTVVKALQPQADKIIQIFKMGLGWELWAQAELGVQRRLEADESNHPDAYEGIETSCMREQMVYWPTQKRCDFLTSYTLSPSDEGGETQHLHEFLELKCLIQGKLNSFKAAVRADIDKVQEAQAVLPDWANANYVAGTVMAITVHENGDGTVEDTMQDLALEKGIKWLSDNGNAGVTVEETEDCTIMAWIWIRTLVTDDEESERYDEGYDEDMNSESDEMYPPDDNMLSD